MQHINPRKRHKARCFALQALYQWQLTGNDIDEIVLRFISEMNQKKTDIHYFRQLVHEIVQQTPSLDTTFAAYLDRSLDALGPIELAILRLSTYEMIACPDLPYKVVLNEAIELAKTFAAEDAHKYINAILDKVAVKLRHLEVNAGM